MSFAGATAFANAEAECPNRINRVLVAVNYFPQHQPTKKFAVVPVNFELSSK